MVILVKYVTNCHRIEVNCKNDSKNPLKMELTKNNVRQSINERKKERAQKVSNDGTCHSRVQYNSFQVLLD